MLPFPWINDVYKTTGQYTEGLRRNFFQGKGSTCFGGRRNCFVLDSIGGNKESKILCDAENSPQCVYGLHELPETFCTASAYTKANKLAGYKCGVTPGTERDSLCTDYTFYELTEWKKHPCPKGKEKEIYKNKKFTTDETKTDNKNLFHVTECKQVAKVDTNDGKHKDHKVTEPNDKGKFARRVLPSTECDAGDG